MSLLYEFGMTPTDIKSSIIDSFSKYFNNSDNLEKYAITDLVGTWISYLTSNRNYPDSIKFIDTFVTIFNDAKRVNESETIDAYINWFPDLGQSISRFWSLYNSQTDLLQMCIEDFLEEALRIIGKTIEGLSKPFFKLLLHLNRIARHKTIDIIDIQSKDLGIVIDELINTTSLKDLLILQPNNIRLNQWRNIAYHHNSKIIEGRIFCSIKRNGNIEEFEITRDDLLEALKRILGIFRLIRISETLFCLDNIQQIQQKTDSQRESQLNVREESKLLEFYSALSSQGFSVTDLEYDATFAKLDVRDMEEYSDFPQRAIHSSQFLYNLWVFSQSNLLVLNYYLFTGEKYFTSEIKSSNFLKHESSNSTFSKMMEEVKFSYLNLEYRQDLNPFTNLNLSTAIKNHPHKFYSQLGEQIPIKEFVRQFTLSVFCNYLALRSEGIEDIKINIGKDGSMIRTETPRSLILHVPARIENKKLVIELIRLVKITINLYDTKLLKREIVIESKRNNQYYYKKDLIKEQLRTKE
jgi:hypothetical protein